MTPVFDRSRSEAYAKCPRKRFLEYEYPTGMEVNGLQRKAHAVTLLTGGMVHRGLEHLLTSKLLGEAIAVALELYDDTIAERGIMDDEVSQIGTEDDMYRTWVVKVQRALIEALVRGWERVCWPRIVQEFDVLEVEREERATFHYDTEHELTLLARMDVLLRRKADGLMFIRNFKTINEASDRKIQAFRYDTQTISEVLATEQRINNQPSIWNPAAIDGIKLGGVIYDLLVKGKKNLQYPRGSGIWHNSSPLIWCFHNESQSSADLPALAAKWEYTCSEPHQMGRGFCNGNANHTLGKGWERKLVTEVFEASPIEEWLDWLAENEPQPLQDQFITLPAIERTPFDVETWLQSVLPEEIRIHEMAEECREQVADDGLLESLPLLDARFPKHTANGNCIWPNKCPMFDICWGGASQLDDPREEGEFIDRVANHPEAITSDVI